MYLYQTSVIATDGISILLKPPIRKGSYPPFPVKILDCLDLLHHTCPRRTNNGTDTQP